MTLGPESRPIRSDRVLAQQVEGVAVLLSLDDGWYYQLNAVGSVIWDLCDGTHAVAEIGQAVYAQFATSPERAQADVAAFVESLVADGLVVVADSPP